MPEYFDWVTAKPLPVEKWTAIFKPFSIPTWMFFITFSLGAGPVLATLVHLSEHDPGSNVHGIQRSGGLFNRNKAITLRFGPVWPIFGVFKLFRVESVILLPFDYLSLLSIFASKNLLNIHPVLYVVSVLWQNPTCETDSLPRMQAPRLFLAAWWLLV